MQLEHQREHSCLSCMARPRFESEIASLVKLMWRMSATLSLPSLTAEDRERSLRAGRVQAGRGVAVAADSATSKLQAASEPSAAKGLMLPATACTIACQQSMCLPAVPDCHMLQGVISFGGFQADGIVCGVHVSVGDADVAAAVHINACTGGRRYTVLLADCQLDGQAWGECSCSACSQAHCTIIVWNPPIAADNNALNTDVLAAQHVQAPVDRVCSRQAGRRQVAQVAERGQLAAAIASPSMLAWAVCQQDHLSR